jgi:hypothetical protein
MESVETGSLGGLATASSCSPTGRPLPFSSETRFVSERAFSWLVSGDPQGAERRSEVCSGQGAPLIDLQQSACVPK